MTGWSTWGELPNLEFSGEDTGHSLSGEAIFEELFAATSLSFEFNNTYIWLDPGILEGGRKTNELARSLQSFRFLLLFGSASGQRILLGPNKSFSTPDLL